MQHVPKVRAKSFMSGGYESFEDKLTGQYKDNDRIRYHVSCITNGP